jgi:hypothetical protein
MGEAGAEPAGTGEGRPSAAEATAAPRISGGDRGGRSWLSPTPVSRAAMSRSFSACTWAAAAASAASSGSAPTGRGDGTGQASSAEGAVELLEALWGCDSHANAVLQRGRITFSQPLVVASHGRGYVSIGSPEGTLACGCSQHVRSELFVLSRPANSCRSDA